ncbi:uncharacterized membrane protein YhaH (DUF805 family) [Crossiella equi]|uniref:Uncharacterized membrane protein YhaH (DUF805 family) n=1 Tax=Crossiella equi TaxID=130796 RepID=A0ABS5AQ94_9PSEU|nr:hypothetical protein [Crossiella equi]MBP2478389.1 uncharacterized membrane protein YhaH (DUF805 family) [Crossiella equi]
MTAPRFDKGNLVVLLISTTIATGFGAGWWFFGAGVSPAASTALRVAGGVLLATLLGWLAVTARRGRNLPGAQAARPGPFGKVYGIAVLLMLVGIVGGARVLTGVFALPEAVPAWVLFVVGLHFLPFTRLFGSRRFLVLSVALCLVAVLAAVLGAAGQVWAWQGVVGFGAAAVLWGLAAVALVDGNRRIAA